jgi:hypothetical protein
MDVPEMMLYSTRLLSLSSSEGDFSPVQAARMSTPGAVMSGLRISGAWRFGPRLEKSAILGGRRRPTNDGALERDHRGRRCTHAYVLLDLLGSSKCDGRCGEDVRTCRRQLAGVLRAPEDCSGATGEFDSLALRYLIHVIMVAQHDLPGNESSVQLPSLTHVRAHIPAID